MTTPRVTVPVEDLLFCKLKDLILEQSEGEWTDEMIVRDAHHFANHIRPLLSAAPAPEGGAVRYRHKNRGTEYTLIGVGRAQGELQDDDPVVLYRGDDGGLWVRHQVEFCDGRFEQVSALASRAEAPADAGDFAEVAAFVEAMSAKATSEVRILDTAVPVQAIRSLLRAQPPAREDAQPVDGDWQSIAMWMGFAASVIKSGEPWTDQCQREFDEAKAAYARLSATHPAPDALRVAVEALEPFARVMIDVGESESDDDTFRNARREYARGPTITVGHVRRAASALAALQAEQKGGA
ncbi:hypothetical protein V8F63_09535 [Brevundimonas sp. LF-1]|uniref:hypothetical protein n=1 Tax=Brevundimonas sp. LF-1 TaxID=3126100 RepID=UPI0030DF80C7